MRTIRGHLLRDIVAISVVSLFLSPILFWAATSFKPAAAIYDKDRVVLFDFEPTLSNYAISLGSGGPNAFGARQAILDSLLIASAVTLLTMLVGTMAAFGLNQVSRSMRTRFVLYCLIFRQIPPIAVIVPAAFTMRVIGLFDTHGGVIAMHMVFTIPIATLMIGLYLDEIPTEIRDAARLDGATAAQRLIRIYVPLIGSGLAATAVLCFIFSWTEFLMSLFLTVSFRTLPVMLAILPMGMWGALAALGTVTMVPCFAVFTLLQRHMTRGMTLGMQT